MQATPVARSDSITPNSFSTSSSVSDEVASSNTMRRAFIEESPGDCDELLVPDVQVAKPVAGSSARPTRLRNGRQNALSLFSPHA